MRPPVPCVRPGARRYQVNPALRIDDVRDPFDVETTRGDISRDQHGMLARAEALHRRQPFLLRSIRMQRRGTNAFRHQVRVTRSASTFRRTNTSTGPSASRFANDASQSIFVSRSTSTF